MPRVVRAVEVSAEQSVGLFAEQSVGLSAVLSVELSVGRLTVITTHFSFVLATSYCQQPSFLFSLRGYNAYFILFHDKVQDIF